MTSTTRLDSTCLLSRRQTLGAMAAIPIAMYLAAVQAAAAPPSATWDLGAAWTDLRRKLGDRLIPVYMPNLGSPAGIGLLANPIAVGDEPALTQSCGWVDAWQSAPSRYAVKAGDAADISRAVRFAPSWDPDRHQRRRP